MKQFSATKKKYKLFIFDFDGTLGDTKECIVASFQKTLKENRLPNAKREQIIYYTGLPLKEVFEKLIKKKLDDIMLNNLVENYRKFYREFLTQKTLIFPKVAVTLKKLKENGKLCAVATSKKTEFAILSCKYLKIDQYFDLYIGDDLVAQKKPNPEMLLHILKKLQIDIKDAVMIGDSTFDIQMGNAINMDTIAVTWGAHSKEQLQKENPTYMIHNFEKLAIFT
jgi:phosphoglycolate phosphatase/pyrophosphatase PpaX